MEPLFALLLPLLPFLSDADVDPASRFWLGRQHLRTYACDFTTHAEAHERYPGRVPEPPPRFVTARETHAMICLPPILPEGVKGPRDELVLDGLKARMDALASRALVALEADVRWVVDAYYPSPRVSVRIATAARAALAERGLPVSNRAPLLAAGDLLVMRELSLVRAFSLACQRYAAEGGLADDEALLAVVLPDPRASELVAGVCHQGRFRWLP